MPKQKGQIYKNLDIVNHLEKKAKKEKIYISTLFIEVIKKNVILNKQVNEFIINIRITTIYYNVKNNQRNSNYKYKIVQEMLMINKRENILKNFDFGLEYVELFEIKKDNISHEEDIIGALDFLNSNKIIYKNLFLPKFVIIKENNENTLTYFINKITKKELSIIFYYLRRVNLNNKIKIKLNYYDLFFIFPYKNKNIVLYYVNYQIVFF